jgi:HrpA-like RNA helicase
VYHATEDHEEDRVDAALKQCFQLHVTKPPGDILVFMPGEFSVPSSTTLILSQVKRKLRDW